MSDPVATDHECRCAGRMLSHSRGVERCVHAPKPPPPHVCAIPPEVREAVERLLVQVDAAAPHVSCAHPENCMTAAAAEVRRLLGGR